MSCIPDQLWRKICHHHRSDLASEESGRSVVGCGSDNVLMKLNSCRRNGLPRGVTRVQNERKPIRLCNELYDAVFWVSISFTAVIVQLSFSGGKRASILSESSSIPVKSTTYPSIALLCFSSKLREVHTCEKSDSSSDPTNRKSSR